MSYEWSEGGGGNYIKLKVGEPFSATVLKVEKTDKGKYHLKRQGEDLGWHVQVTTDKGVLSVNSWGLYFACQGACLTPNKVYNFECLEKGGLGKMGKYNIFEIPPETKDLPVVDEPFTGTTQPDADAPF